GMAAVPALLAVCSQVAPLGASPAPSIAALPTPQLKAHIRALGGTSQAVMDADELWQLIEPGVRADYEAVESYRAAALPLLSCDVLACYGAADSQVDRADIEGWGQVTSGGFEIRALGGEHFLLESAAQELIGELTGRLLAAPGTPVQGVRS